MRRILGLVLCLAPTFAWASSLDVDPIRVTFTPQSNIAVVTLTNAGDNASTIQLEPVAWSQSQGEDVYNPTHDLLATPPIFTVQPKSKQIIRLALRVAPNPAKEMTYRLYLQEVPPPSQVRGLGVIMALRIGVPVFVEPAVPVKPVLQWTATRLANGQLRLDASNIGTAHVQVRQISVSGPGVLSLVVQQAAYVLPGADRSWTVKLSKPLAAGTKLDISCDTDVGTLNAQTASK